MPFGSVDKKRASKFATLHSTGVFSRVMKLQHRGWVEERNTCARNWNY